MLTVTVLENTPCPNCETTKRTLTRNGVPFEHRPVTDDDVQLYKSLLPNTVLSAPIVEISGSVDEIEALRSHVPLALRATFDGGSVGYWYGLRMDILVGLKTNRRFFVTE